MSKIDRIVLGKGVTRKVVGTEKDYEKRYLQIEVLLPDQQTEETFHESLVRAEILIDQWLTNPVQLPKTVQTTEGFDSSDLMEHSWKGKRDPNRAGEHLKGSLSWGWDFKTAFKETTIRTLENGNLTIDGTVFSVTENLVSAKKEK